MSSADVTGRSPTPPWPGSPSRRKVQEARWSR